jgi:hypothetical protein
MRSRRSPTPSCSRSRTRRVTATGSSRRSRRASARTVRAEHGRALPRAPAHGGRRPHRGVERAAGVGRPSPSLLVAHTRRDGRWRRPSPSVWLPSSPVGAREGSARGGHRVSRRWVRRILAHGAAELPEPLRGGAARHVRGARSARPTARGAGGSFGLRECCRSATWLVCRLRLGFDGSGGGRRGSRAALAARACSARTCARRLRALVRNPGFSAAAVGRARARHRRRLGDLRRGQRLLLPAASVRVIPTDSSSSSRRTPSSAGSTRLRRPPTSSTGASRWMRSPTSPATPSSRTSSRSSATASPIVVTGTEVMGNFFSTLGVPAALGRTFRLEETWAGETTSSC